MKKIILIGIVAIIASFALIDSALAINLDFKIDIEDKVFYPNEKIPVSVTITNSDYQFAAKNAKLAINAGLRHYEFDLGDIEKGDTVTKSIELPEFPAGSHQVRGTLNYTWLFNEIFSEEAYNALKVRFPDFVRIPQQVSIKNVNIAENVTSGQAYDVVATVSNEGNIGADLTVKVTAPNTEYSTDFSLATSETKDITIKAQFHNSGISLVEIGVYAKVSGEFYLLDYLTKPVFIKSSGLANLTLEGTSLSEEDDGEINRNDNVKLKINLKNEGKYSAYNVKGTLTSSEDKIVIENAIVDYGIIAEADISSGRGTYSIKTNDAEPGNKTLQLKITFSDNEGAHEAILDVPLNVLSGSDACSKDSDCADTELCSNAWSPARCIPVPCDCGEVKNHKCNKYECCSDSDCGEYQQCNAESHSCRPVDSINAKVLIITSSKLNDNGEYNAALNDYRTTLESDDLNSFYIKVDSSEVKNLFNIDPADASDWKSVKAVIDKITYKIKPEYLVIIGGVKVIPQPPAKTSAAIPAIPVSDDRYADTDLDGIPDLAVGRMPSYERDPAIIISTIKSSIATRQKNNLKKAIVADTCIFPPSCWGINDVNHISQIMFEVNCDKSDKCYPVPPYCSGGNCNKPSEFWDIFRDTDFIHLDAHGSPYSFAAHNNDGWYTVLTSSALYDKRFNVNPSFSTIACHSGTIDCEEGSCISKSGSVFYFLANGASTYVGNTRYGYGGISARLIGSYIKNLQAGKPAGKALLEMKQKELKNCWSEQCRAIVYELQLYGDPTLKVNI